MDDFEKEFRNNLVKEEILAIIEEKNQRIAELEEQLKNATKQVRKEVVQEIKDLAGNYFKKQWCDYCGEIYEDIFLTGNDLTEILDQIQNIE